MKGRYQGESILLIFEILDNTDEQKISGILFMLDFEKAFDSVSSYMYRCLEHFNFGEILINWTKSFYNVAKSCVSNNGYQSDFLKYSPRC